VFAKLAARRSLTEARLGPRCAAARRRPREDAKRANALLPARHALNDKTLDRAQADPAIPRAREVADPVASSKELALFAVARLARAKPDEAADRLVLMTPRLGSVAAEFAWSHLGLQAAMQHHPRALAYYAMARDIPLTETQVAWKARAAMRAADWPTVLAAIQALPPEEAREATWRYWRARAFRALGETRRPRACSRDSRARSTSMGLLAAEELNAATPPSWNGVRPEAADLERMRAVPGIRRALALYAAGLDTEALREWIWAAAGPRRPRPPRRPPRSRASPTSPTARSTPPTGRCSCTTSRSATRSRTATRSRRSAEQWDLDEAMVYSIIRRRAASCPRRARVAATGADAAHAGHGALGRRARFRCKPFTTRDAHAAEAQHPHGHLLLPPRARRPRPSAARSRAYNAGPGRARRWRDERALDGAIYVETIPFNETRDYVKQVFANAWFYATA
jgi:soluble lytic murein transglycosylase